MNRGRGLAALLLVCTAGVMLRAGHLLAVANDPMLTELVMDSLEYHHWALSIMQGQWWPTAPFFQVPLYPYLVALAYVVLRPDPLVVYALQILIAPIGWIALWALGRRLSSSSVALTAVVVAAAYWPFIFCDVQLAKESLAVTLVVCLLWLVVRGREQDHHRTWLAAGVVVGGIALLRENMLLVLPILFALGWTRQGGLRSAVIRTGLLCSGAALMLAPVSWVNWQVGGSPFPTTFNGGVVLYIGNNPEADGTYQPIVQGRQVPFFERSGAVEIAEHVTGRALSPSEVSSFWLARSLLWIRAEPLAWVGLMLTKLGMYWQWYEWPDAIDPEYIRRLSPLRYLPLVEFGGVTLLALVGAFMVRHDAGRWAPVLLWVPAWTFSTVIFFVFSRYRLPMVPALILLAAVPLARAVEGVRSSPSIRALGVALLAVALLLGPAAFRPQPRMDLVEYNLGAIDLRLGDADGAEAHFRAALDHNPRMYLAWMNRGVLQAGRGDLRNALDSLRRARTLEPRAPDAAASLGAALLQAGAVEPAQRQLLAAVELDPYHRDAWHNLSLVAERRGDLGTASARNRRVLDLDPQFPPALRLRNRLQHALVTQAPVPDPFG